MSDYPTTSIGGMFPQVAAMMEGLLAERNALGTRIATVLALHQPTDGMGYEPDNGGSYGEMSRVCTTCGTSDEYGVKWPCATARAVGATAEAQR